MLKTYECLVFPLTAWKYFFIFNHNAINYSMVSNLTKSYCWAMLIPYPAQIFFYPLLSANFLIIPLLSVEILLVFKIQCTYCLAFLCVLLAVLSLDTLRVRYGLAHLISWAASLWQVGYMLGQPGVQLFHYCHQLGTLRLACNSQQILLSRDMVVNERSTCIFSGLPCLPASSRCHGCHVAQSISPRFSSQESQSQRSI